MLISSMRTDADDRDPVACRLTHNILAWAGDTDAPAPLQNRRGAV